MKYKITVYHFLIDLITIHLVWSDDLLSNAGMATIRISTVFLGVSILFTVRSGAKHA
jgi:hypothetical protein